MPRKESASFRCSSGRAGFNEAGAVMPRKGADLRNFERRRVLASMRPGLLCPGKRAAANARRGYCFGFNEAGAVMPRKGRRNRNRGADRRASMRPGLLCPGKPATDLTYADFDGALQ